MESHLFPFTFLKLMGVALMIILVSPSNVAGIGGGVFFVPLLISIYKYDTHTAMHMSSILVFSASLLKVYFASTQKHPKRNRPSIDFNTLIIITPSLLLSVKFGVILHSVLPEFYLLLALCTILFFISYLTFQKGMQFYRSENSSKSLIKKNNNETEILENYDSDTKKVLMEEANMFPMHKVTILILSLLLLVVTNIAIEGIDSVSIMGFHRCSTAYWIMFSIFILGNLALIYKGYLIAYHEIVQRKLRSLIVYPQDEIGVTKGIKLSLIGVVAGMLAGVFGIGGGVFMNPLLLQLGHFPEVVTSTSIILILISTAASSFQYLMISSFNLWDTNFFNFFTLCGTLFANMYITEKIKKTGRSSIIVFVTMAVLFLSGVFSLYIAIYKYYGDYEAVMHMQVYCK